MSHRRNIYLFWREDAVFWTRALLHGNVLHMTKHFFIPDIDANSAYHGISMFENSLCQSSSVGLQVLLYYFVRNKIDQFFEYVGFSSTSYIEK